MKAKWKLHYFISILMIPVLLFASVKIAKTPHAEDVKQLFMEYQEEFNEVAFELMAIFYRNYEASSVLMTVEDPIYGEYVGQIESLKFFNLGPLLPEEEYENMHDVVSSLFNSLDLCSIGGDWGGIQFVVSESYFGNCRLFFVPFGGQLNIDMSVKEKIRICSGWYAVVTYD